LTIGKLPMLLLVMATIGCDWGGLYFLSLVLAIGATFCVGGAVAIFFFRGAANTAWGVAVATWSQLLGCIFFGCLFINGIRYTPTKSQMGIGDRMRWFVFVGVTPIPCIHHEIVNSYLCSTNFRGAWMVSSYVFCPPDAGVRLPVGGADGSW